MTTNVTVKTHSWPVKITTTDCVGDNDPVTSEQTVPPNSESTVYLTQNRSLSFEELPLETASAEQPIKEDETKSEPTQAELEDRAGGYAVDAED